MDIVHLDEIATSLRRNAEIYINQLDSPDELYVSKFRNMYKHIANSIENNQRLPVNLVTTALRILYFKKDRYTVKQMATILKGLGGTLKC